MAYAVTRRTAEIGIRMALGARQGHVQWMVLRETLWLTVAGVTAGVPLALWTAGLAKSLLFGVQPAVLVSLTVRHSSGSDRGPRRLPPGPPRRTHRPHGGAASLIGTIKPGVSMRPTLVLLFAFTLHGADIPQGSHVLLRMVNSISTRTAAEGNYVYMKTATPMVANGRGCCAGGSYVQGVVVAFKRSGRVQGHAELSIRIETLTLPSGKVVKITPHLSSVDSEGTDQKVDKEGGVQQGGSKGTDAAKIATTAGTGAALGAIVDRSVEGAGIGAGRRAERWVSRRCCSHAAAK